MRYVTRPNRRAGKVAIAPGVDLTVWREVTVLVTDYKGFDVDVRVVTSGSRVEANAVSVRRRDGGPPVTSEALRSITVAAFVRCSLDASIGGGSARGTLDTVEDVERFLGDTVAHRLMTRSEAAALRAAGPSPETLQMVATVYQVAYALGDSPTKAVRESFGVAQSTAGNWIAAARAASLLSPATTSGKANP